MPAEGWVGTFRSRRGSNCSHEALEAEFGMGSQPHQLQGLFIRLAIDEGKVGPDMAIAMIFPIASQRMVSEPCVQHIVLRELLQEERKLGLQ